MNLDFDLKNIISTEFCASLNGDKSFIAVPCDEQVNELLHNMVIKTCKSMQNIIKDDAPKIYDISDEYKATDYLIIEIEDIMATNFRDLYQAKNLDSNINILNDPNKVEYYAIRLTDKENRSLTAMRRATYFKGICKKSLIHFTKDQLIPIKYNIFKLDSDFDLFIDSKYVHIYRQKTFESFGDLKEKVKKAVYKNVADIKKHLSFVNFESIQDYAIDDFYVARCLASIRKNDHAKDITPEELKDGCNKHNISMEDINGEIIIEENRKNIKRFVKFINRRLFLSPLDTDKKYLYEASSRRRISH